MSDSRGSGSRWFRVADEDRDWEDFYRKRWSFDRSVRTTHSVNCSGSCSWEVFVKDGLISWELQKTDYPQIRSDTPNYEPRGCQRGISASWYPYSPVRPKYPYVRGVLWEMYGAERQQGKDAVEAWAAVAEDPERKARYQQARGKAGWRRATWDEVTEIIAAATIHTIREYGADHLASFSPIPAMSMVSFLSGSRLCNLLGGTMLSFYEWYHDLPHIMPMMFGDQTDVHESADWYQSAYWIVAGSNLPMTRTPDAHFASEFKYNGGKLVNLSPDYSDVTKFSDLWVPANSGTDAAFLTACIHVILEEFYAERETPYFRDYVKQYTNLPFLVTLEPDGEGGWLQGRFLRAGEVEPYTDEENAEWKLVVEDAEAGEIRMPGGSVGFRWEEERTGRWNLKQEDARTGESIDPRLSFLDRDHREVPVRFADFTETFDVSFGETDDGGRPADDRERAVPARTVTTADGEEVLVTTAFDLLMAQMGVDRGLGGDYPDGYDEAAPYTPAWQERETGVDRDLVLRVAREWAETAEKTEGKCLFITGSGVLHWYHGGSLTYRAMAVMGILTGCMGTNGGGFAHYVGTEKVRPFAAVAELGNAADWADGPPRHQNSTSYFYFHTDQWRYDGMALTPQWAPWAEEMPGKGEHASDQNMTAVRLGWLPFYPQFDGRTPQEVLGAAREDGAETEEEVARWVAEQFEEGDLRFALEDVDAPDNHPKVMWVYRGNLIGTSMRGHEYALKHLLGTHHNVLGDERGEELAEGSEWRDEAPEGKLDLLVNANLRMDSSANYSDIVLPAAHWYEKYDLTCTDLHSFFHPFTPAHDPPWEARDDWDTFKAIAAKISELAEEHLPDPVEEVVVTALNTDTRDELAQPLGEVRDWKTDDVAPVPGETFPRVSVVERDYTRVLEKYRSLGPGLKGEDGFGAKGIRTDLSPVYEELKENRLVGERDGRPDLDQAQQVAETILRISPESDGEMSHRLFKELEERCGVPLTDLIGGERELEIHYDDLISQPRRSLTSPHWSAIESPGRTYCPWTLNVEALKPFHTLSGRQEIYFDHRAYRELGESLPTYKPPLDMTAVGDCPAEDGRGALSGNGAGGNGAPPSKAFRFLTPHGKWQIHSMFWDNWHMQNMFRGGPVVWLSEDDARQIGVEDNDWVEIYNENGIQVVRAVLSPTMPRNTAIVYHMSERHLNVPFSPLAVEEGASDLRGGNNNAPTRILMNPATMVGGYANWTYFLNYWGTSPSERDCVVRIRKMPAMEGAKDVIYREEDLPERVRARFEGDGAS